MKLISQDSASRDFFDLIYLMKNIHLGPWSICLGIFEYNAENAIFFCIILRVAYFAKACFPCKTVKALELKDSRFSGVAGSGVNDIAETGSAGVNTPRTEIQQLQWHHWRTDFVENFH
jgi:hypothetical protein